jgi:hypothetical protein
MRPEIEDYALGKRRAYNLIRYKDWEGIITQCGPCSPTNKRYELM